MNVLYSMSKLEHIIFYHIFLLNHTLSFLLLGGFDNHEVVAFFETSVFKEVRILSPLSPP